MQIDVPESTWAVFEAAGPFPETLQDVWERIYSEWFPSSAPFIAPLDELITLPQISGYVL